MNTVLNKYHPSSLHSSKTSLQSFLIPRCARGQSNTWCGKLRGYMWGSPPAISFFLVLRREVRLPKVLFFWASLMEREIIMSWPVNNCMPQWDICQYYMLYVLHPWRTLTKQKGCLCSPSSWQSRALFTGRQIQKRAMNITPACNVCCKMDHFSQLLT